MTEDDILRIQDNAILNNTKKATKFSELNNVLTHSLLECPVSSVLAAFLNHDFLQSSFQVSSISVEQNVSTQENLNVTVSKNDCDLQQQVHGMISGENLTNYSQFNFKFNFK